MNARRKIGYLLCPASMLSAIAAFLLLISPAAAEKMHGIAMHGEPALPEGFTHFPYANPDAPKGGKITYGWRGSFDSVNPFIVQGAGVRGLRDYVFGDNVFESLLIRSRDEPFTMYGLLAESIEMPDDRSEITFHIRPEAAWSDGTPLTREDVIFTIELLGEKGRPNYRRYRSRIAEIERVGENGVRFVFNDEADREFPLIMGLIPILPKHAIDPATFDKSTLVPIIGSGPYTLETVESGSHIVLKRNPDYWGRDLPAKQGFDNYDEIRVEYYRDANAMFEAFKKGLFDFNIFSDPQRWTDGLEIPAVQDGRIAKDVIQSGSPAGMQAFVFNTRRDVFSDVRVRKALAQLLDFEWLNKNIYFGLYHRTNSFFEGSDLASTGQAPSETELGILEPFMDELDPEVVSGDYRAPVSDGSGRDRSMFQNALSLFSEAGYELKDGRLVSAADGSPLSFEFLADGRDAERLALAYKRNLDLLGIDMQIRLVDAAQYQQRLQTYDFDMIQFFYRASLSPGNEQNFRWGPKSADTDGTFNMSGSRTPAISAAIDAMLTARDRTTFRDAVRALDRVLLSGHYVVPLFHQKGQWVARASRLRMPENTSLYGVRPATWWDSTAEDSQ